MPENNFPIISETYRFECQCCGNCCTGDQRVYLNLYDVYKMARFLKLENSKELFTKSYLLLENAQNNVWLPRIRFKEKPFKFCPFLSNEQQDDASMKGYCRMHPFFKPLICSLAPVGRIVNLDSDEDEFVFVKPAPDCPGVESDRINQLSDLKNQHADELKYQREFFILLEKTKKLSFTKEDYLEKIYSFDCRVEFPGIQQLIKSNIFTSHT